MKHALVTTATIQPLKEDETAQVLLFLIAEIQIVLKLNQASAEAQLLLPTHVRDRKTLTLEELQLPIPAIALLLINKDRIQLYKAEETKTHKTTIKETNRMLILR
jgi:hypothetical protein